MYHPITNQIIIRHNPRTINKRIVSLNRDGKICALQCAQLHSMFQLGAVAQEPRDGVVVEDLSKLLLRHGCRDRIK